MENEGFVENFGRWSCGSVTARRAGEAFVQPRRREPDISVYKNELELDGKHVDLDNIDMPSSSSWVSTTTSSRRSSADQRCHRQRRHATVEFSTGHIGLSVSSSTHADLWPEVAEWYSERSTGSEDVDIEVESPEAAEDDAVDRRTHRHRR